MGKNIADYVNTTLQQMRESVLVAMLCLEQRGAITGEGKEEFLELIDKNCGVGSND